MAQKKTKTNTNIKVKKTTRTRTKAETRTKEQKRLDEIERLKAVIAQAKIKKREALQIKEQYVSTHLWEFFKPFRWQDNCRDLFNDNIITLAPAPNGIGKTTEVVVFIMSWLAGYEAWNPVEPDYPGAVKVDKKYYKPSSLGIPTPVRGRLTGQDWSHHLGQTVVRELKKWFPMEEFDTKNNTQGVTWFWSHRKTGSTLELMTHDQKIDLYESWRGHFWVADEPPPENIFDAMSGRGLSDFGGKILIPATPLTQAWMLDKLVLSGRSDVGIMKNLCALDNEVTYAHDDDILSKMGLTGKKTKYWGDADGQKKQFFDMIMRWDLYLGTDGAESRSPDDQGKSAEQFLIDNTPESRHGLIKELRFLRRVKDTPLEDKPSRFFGMFKKLVGLVIKNFDKSRHIVPFPRGGVPTDWVVTVLIDLHLNKPHAISFYGCDKHNRHYCIDEYWVNCTPEEIADIIIRKKKGDLCWNISNVYIDPLSKGDNKFMENRVDVEDSYTIIGNRLSEEGIYLQTASKDKESGMRNIRAWLEGPNSIPILFFFDTLQSAGGNTRGIVFDIQRLCFDNNGKVEKINDDFMENLYRYTLTGTEYVEEETPVLIGAGQGQEQSWMGM